MCLLTICMSSLEKYLFRRPFSLGCLFFGYWVVWAVWRFWRLSPYQLHCLQIFPPSPYVVLSFCLVSFLCKHLSVWLGPVCFFLLLFLLPCESKWSSSLENANPSKSQKLEFVYVKSLCESRWAYNKYNNLFSLTGIGLEMCMWNNSGQNYMRVSFLEIYRKGLYWSWKGCTKGK